MTQVPPAVSSRPAPPTAGKATASSAGSGFADTLQQVTATPVRPQAIGRAPASPPATDGTLTPPVPELAVEALPEGAVQPLLPAAWRAPNLLPEDVAPPEAVTLVDTANLPIMPLDPGAAPVTTEAAPQWLTLPADPPLTPPLGPAPPQLGEAPSPRDATAAGPWLPTSQVMPSPSAGVGAAPTPPDGEVGSSLLGVLDGAMDEFASTVGRETPAALAGPSAAAGTREPPAVPPGLQPGVKVSFPAELPMGHQEWAERLAERGASLVARGLNSAELQLDPPELGALQVRIQVRDEVATIQFISPHAQVREALDQTANRLREMLSEQGFREVHTDVSDGRGQDRRDGAERGEGPRTATGDAVPEPEGEVRLSPDGPVLGVDQFV